MDLIDKLRELANRIQRQKDSVLTEEAVKTAFVLPFLQALGYDVFNPAEVIPEFTADHGVKKTRRLTTRSNLKTRSSSCSNAKPSERG